MRPAPKRTLVIGGGIVAGAAVVAVVLAGAAILRHHSAAHAAATGDIAVRTGGTSQFAAVPWGDVPAPVVAWIHAHAAAPAQGTVQVGPDTWAVLTSGRQPTAVKLLPLIVTRSTAGAPSIEVALAPGAKRSSGAQSSLAVELPPGTKDLTFDLHLVGGGPGVPLGTLPIGTCASGADALSAAQGCAQRLGLKGARWSEAGGGVRAVVGGQTISVTTQPGRGGVVPSAVQWAGPAPA